MSDDDKTRIAANVTYAGVGTQLKNPDFAMYAKAFGGHGERVERTEEFAPALGKMYPDGTKLPRLALSLTTWL